MSLTKPRLALQGQSSCYLGTWTVEHIEGTAPLCQGAWAKSCSQVVASVRGVCSRQ